MDFSKFKVSDWLMVAAGAVMLILGMVLDWAKLGSASGNGPFDYFFTGGISWLLVVAAGIIAFLLAAGIMKPGGPPWALLLVLGTGLATLLMLIRIILGGGSEGAGGFEVDFDRGPGMYVAFVAAIVALVGAVLNYKESGGDLNDLKDFNKIKGAFNKPGDATPPPPPPPPAV
jgi:hypothetical protein